MRRSMVGNQPKVVKESRNSEQGRLDAMSALISTHKSAFQQAREVLRRIRSVPTIFPGVDRILDVGGWPIDRIATVHGPSAHGKALTMESKILTPSGWIYMSDVKEGMKVIGANGLPHNVLGVFPQGLKQVYRVFLSDNTFVECCADHLWFTTTLSEMNKGRFVRGPRPKRVRLTVGKMGLGSVKSLADIMSNWKSKKHWLPIILPVQYEPIVDSLPLDPYLLGLLLGDGGLTGTSVYFFKPENDLHQEVVDRIPFGDRVVRVDKMTARIIGGNTKKILRDLGLVGKKHTSKFIPEIYLRASVEDRCLLLMGLLDTDGHVTKEGSLVEFSTSSPYLRDGVAEIARSLGAIVNVRMKVPKYTYKNKSCEGSPMARISISFPDGWIPISSKKHLARWTERKSIRRRSISKIVPVGYKDCQCIAVDSPDNLFVTNDFIITHNTSFCAGLGLSFLKKNHFFKLVDAERTTSISWVEKLYGEIANHIGFSAIRPDTYEHAVDDIRRWATAIGEAKYKGKLPQDTTGLAVIDSIRKLVPKDFQKKVAKALSSETGVDGFRGRGAQIKAQLHAAWLDELVPLMDSTGTALVFITRESEDVEADANDRRFGKDYKITGGRAIVYDASLLIRVERASWIYGPGPDGAKKPVYGEKHRVVVSKSKIATKEGSSVSAFFHTSNGVLVPEGFDHARDVLVEAKSQDIVKGDAWLSWRKNRWNGEHQATKKLTASPELLIELENEVRASWVG